MVSVFSSSQLLMSEVPKKVLVHKLKNKITNVHNQGLLLNRVLCVDMAMVNGIRFNLLNYK